MFVLNAPSACPDPAIPAAPLITVGGNVGNVVQERQGRDTGERMGSIAWALEIIIDLDGWLDTGHVPLGPRVRSHERKGRPRLILCPNKSGRNEDHRQDRSGNELS